MKVIIWTVFFLAYQSVSVGDEVEDYTFIVLPSIASQVSGSSGSQPVTTVSTPTWALLLFG